MKKKNLNNKATSPEPRSAFANSLYFGSSSGSDITTTSTFLPQGVDGYLLPSPTVPLAPSTFKNNHSFTGVSYLPMEKITNSAE